MVRAALIGLGKMGLSHLAIIRAHPEIDLVAVCDTAGYLRDALSKYAGIKTHSNFRTLLDEEKLDAVFIATPSRMHSEMVALALERNLHVFCEKPFCLDVEEGRRLAGLAREKKLVNQVGYHYRFVGTFAEARRLIAAGVLGKIHHLRAEAYGPVVLRPQGSTWRTTKSEGGGCLHDYASHAIDAVNYLVGVPESVGGSVLNSIFSRDVEDEVYSTLYFRDGVTGQLAVNWSDESFRKMSTKVTVWGEKGRLTVDRQELQTYLREATETPIKLPKGWHIKYAPDLLGEVWYYLRGEEYSGQIDHFVKCITTPGLANLSDFASANATDSVVEMIQRDATTRGVGAPAAVARAEPTSGTKSGGLLRSLFGR